MTKTRYFISVALLAAVLGVSACDSAEERAEEHFKSSVALLEAGDVDRALVELRNVLSLNEGHKEARLAYARIMRERSRLNDAYSQYLYLAETNPNDIESRRALTEMAIISNEWDEARRHNSKVLEIDPQNPHALAIDAVLRYQKAVLDGDESARREAAQDVRRLGGNIDDKAIAREVAIDTLIRDNEFRAALAEIDAAIADNPDILDLYRRRLGVLNRLGEEEMVQAQLEELVERFPDDNAFRNTLIEWYVSRGNLDDAEKFLRARVAAAGEDAVAENVMLTLFLRNSRSPDVARQELEKLIAAGQTQPIYRQLLATLLFDGGDREAGIAQLEALIEGGAEGDEMLNARIALARMHFATGNQVAGRARIEEVLAEDASNVEGLKLKAEWLTQEDRADEAIVALRSAMDQSPRDPQIMALMASAHIRNGSRGLARDLLSLAVEASNSAPEYALNYARFLAADQNYATAEAVLLDSLRAVPNNLPVLTELGRLYLTMKDWARAEQVEGTLRRLDTDAGRNAATSLEIARLQQQDRGEEAIAMLEALAASGAGGDGAEVAIVRSYFRSGDFEDAEAFIDKALAEDPSRVPMRFLKAALYAATDRKAEAEDTYRALIADDARNILVWRSLYMLKRQAGDVAGASGILDEALAAVPGHPDLLWARAGELEASGDIDGAIAIYDSLYEGNRNSVVVANNLASLITTYRDDPAELERAYVIARRLRGATVPQFQDTYGWIAYRQGLYDEALEHLEPAAAALTEDPLVQFHYAMVLAALSRNDEALEQFRKAVEIAGPADTRPQFETAKAEIKRLEEASGEKPDQ